MTEKRSSGRGGWCFRKVGGGNLRTAFGAGGVSVMTEPLARNTHTLLLHHKNTLFSPYAAPSVTTLTSYSAFPLAVNGILHTFLIGCSLKRLNIYIRMYILYVLEVGNGL